MLSGGENRVGGALQSIAGRPVWRDQTDESRAELVQAAAAAQQRGAIPVYLPDHFLFETRSFPTRLTEVPHGVSVFLHLATQDLNRDGQADIPTEYIFPILLDEDAKLLFSYASPAGLINYSMTVGSELLFNCADTMIASHLPARVTQLLPQPQDVSSYQQLALSPSEQDEFWSSLVLQSKRPLPSRTDKRPSYLQPLLAAHERFGEIATRHVLFQGAGNINSTMGIGSCRFSASWLLSTAVAVGGLTENGSIHSHSVVPSDVGAPFSVEFRVDILGDGRARWTNTTSGLSVITDADLVPYAAVFAVSPRPKRQPSPHGFTHIVNRWSGPGGGLDGSTMTGALLSETSLRYYVGPLEGWSGLNFDADEDVDKIYHVVPGPRRQNLRDAYAWNIDGLNPYQLAKRGDLYYLDEDHDGKPDRLTGARLQGTSLATQFAVALAYLVMTDKRAHDAGRDLPGTPVEFQRRFISNLHEMSGGKIMPRDIDQDFIDRLVMRLYPLVTRSLPSRASRCTL